MTIEKLTIQAAEENAKAAPLRTISLQMTQREFVLDVCKFTKELEALSTRINAVRQKLEGSK